MIDLRSVADAVTAAEVFSATLVDELEADFWAHDRDDTTAADLRDYIVGTARAIGINLRSIAVNASRYQELRTAQDYDSRQWVRAGGMPYPTTSGDGRYNEREAELDAHEQGFFVALGGVLDCLAGLLAGICGLKTNVIRADFGRLGLPTADLETYPPSRMANLLAAEGTELREQQIQALRSLAVAVDQAGPPGWIDWALAMRNMLVHREHRNELIVNEQSRQHGIVFYRLPPKNPSASNLGAFRAAETDITKFYLWEDLGDVLLGLRSSIVAVTIGTIEVLTRTWRWRATHPEAAVDPSSQWSPGPQRSDFGGYGVSVPQTLLENTVLVMNPSEAARLRSGLRPRQG